MKKLFKILGYVLLAFLLFSFVFWLVMDEKEPIGQPSPEADRMAERMMEAVDKAAWDSTHWLQWDFARGHQYLWDKQRNFVRVRWGLNEVLLNSKTVTGKAYVSGEPVEPDANESMVSVAWGLFCNDSYWLNPMVKAFDPGTERSIVELPDGRKGLKVHYTEGGVTPGDAYVWLLGENGRPVAWKMWVKIIPIGGLENSWEGWQELSTGAWVATTHTFFGSKIEMVSNVRAAVTMEGLGLTEDPFVPLLD